ncbi:LysR family transcriptional regulator [Aestuariimicrobium sp. Y1814]|uniref:LysR family transcriptional regulator n=1 Tax=Aestuariimicrobium sp. Y1814 TaxID=3418742 RepID=UPI003DA6FFD2
MTDDPASLDPKLVLTFREVARMGSISAAARKLGWTQPALGQQLRRLEKEAGTALVRRHARGITLTPAGEVLLGHADAIAGRLLVARAALRDTVRRRSTRLSVASFPSGSSALVAPAVAALAAAVPDLDVRVIDMEPPVAVEALSEGQVDAALVFEHQEDDHYLGGTGQLRRRLLGRDPLLVAMPADHRLALGAVGEGSEPESSHLDAPELEAPALEASELAGETWISGCVWCQSNLTDYGQRHGFTPVIRHTSEDQLVVQQLVGSGLGLALASQMTLRTYQRPGVVARPLVDPPLRTVSLVTHQHDARRVLGRLASEISLTARRSGLLEA